MMSTVIIRFSQMPRPTRVRSGMALMPCTSYTAVVTVWTRLFRLRGTL